MIKVYCDKCGKEIVGKANQIIEETEVFNLENYLITTLKNKRLICDECNESELTYGFKVGDQVITSTGKVGTIIDICTCDKCKDRGFYEPTVEVEIGDGSIWITDNDKRVNFRSFYKIGDYIFGNIDEDCVLDNIKSKKKYIREQQEELIELEAQLDMINVLKKKQ